MTDVRAMPWGAPQVHGRLWTKYLAAEKSPEGRETRGERAPEKRALRGVKETCLVYQNALPLSEYKNNLCKDLQALHIISAQLIYLIKIFFIWGKRKQNLPHLKFNCINKTSSTAFHVISLTSVLYYCNASYFSRHFTP